MGSLTIKGANRSLYGEEPVQIIMPVQYTYCPVQYVYCTGIIIASFSNCLTAHKQAQSNSTHVLGGT